MNRNHPQGKHRTFYPSVVLGNVVYWKVSRPIFDTALKIS